MNEKWKIIGNSIDHRKKIKDFNIFQIYQFFLSWMNKISVFYEFLNLSFHIRENFFDFLFFPVFATTMRKQKEIFRKSHAIGRKIHFAAFHEIFSHFPTFLFSYIFEEKKNFFLLGCSNNEQKKPQLKTNIYFMSFHLRLRVEKV